jgi:uncharacterized protein YggE
MRWIGIAMAVLFALAIPAGAQVPETGRRQIVVNGVGRLEVSPDQASVTVGVQLQRRTAAEAMSEANRVATQIAARLQRVGLRREDMRTSAIQVSPVYAGGQQGAPPRVTGYRASHTLALNIRNLDLVGRAIDAAVEAGANTILGISFGLQDPSRVRNEALALAVRDARAKADAIAQAAGLRIIGIERIVESESDVRPFVTQLEAGLVRAPTPVEPGMVTVSVMVTVAFGYR